MSTQSFTQKYKVLSKVGEGSFSEVLKCQDRATGAVYAAKRLKKIKQNMEEVLSSNELITLQKLESHPHILNMIERHVDPLPGRLTLIFELMDMSLYDLIRTRKRCLPESKVKAYLFQTLKGLSHMHSNGLFHRDIKPENILLKNDTVKIADLGSVKGMYMRKPYTEYISTRWYRSPECLLTKGYYGPKMDIWAAGCVYYELITLRPLFPGHSEVDMIHKIHGIIGTPSSRTITKFKQTRHRNCQYFFPGRSGVGVNALLPNASEAGREILKQMLIYDPDIRASVRRLLEHRYFNDLRELDEAPHKRSSTLPPPVQKHQWKNPVLLSFLTSNKKRKAKLSTKTSTITESSKQPSIKTNVEQKPSVIPTIQARVPSHFIKAAAMRPKLSDKMSTEPSSLKVSPRKKEDSIKLAALKQKQLEKPFGELNTKLKRASQKQDVIRPLNERQQQAEKTFLARNSIKFSTKKGAVQKENNSFVSPRRSMTPLPPIQNALQKQTASTKWQNKPSVVKSPRKQGPLICEEVMNEIVSNLSKFRERRSLEEKTTEKVSLPPINNPRSKLNENEKRLPTKDSIKRQRGTSSVVSSSKSILSSLPKTTILRLPPTKDKITAQSSVYSSSLPQCRKPVVSHLKTMPTNKLNHRQVQKPPIRINREPSNTINR